MFIGVCRVELELPESSSLKDKRQVIRSVTQRIKNRFNVAIAEVDYQDHWRDAALGIACVSNSGSHARAMLESVVAYIDESRLDALTTEVAIEITAVL